MGKRSGKGGCCGWFLVLVVALVVGLAIYFTIKSKHQNLEADGAPGAVSKKYADALKIALQFFDVQKCNSSVSSFSYAILFHIYISRIKKNGISNVTTNIYWLDTRSPYQNLP